MAAQISVKIGRLCHVFYKDSLYKLWVFFCFKKAFQRYCKSLPSQSIKLYKRIVLVLWSG